MQKGISFSYCYNIEKDVGKDGKKVVLRGNVINIDITYSSERTTEGRFD